MKKTSKPRTALALIAICASLLLSCSSPPKPAKAEQKPAANNVPVTPPDDLVVPPEIVQLRGMKIIGEAKMLTMSNSTGE